MTAMIARAAAVVARARALIGVRFRPQGRCAASGVDCIGLAAIAGGIPMECVRGDYGLREGDPATLAGAFAACGLRRIRPAVAGPGDLLVARAGFSQLHVVVLTDEGFVHADAGLRRVVEVPGSVGWPVVSAWRMAQAVGDDSGQGDQ